MVTSEAGKQFIGNEEGVVLHPYLDSVKVPTIGIGSTRYTNGIKVKMTDPSLTREEVFTLFSITLKQYEEAVNTAIKSLINQNQFDALVSLCYNIGTGGFSSSTLVKRINANPKDPTITDAFKMWSKAGSNKTALLGRRTREAKLYFS